MLTQEQLYDGLVIVLRFFYRMLAIIGFIALVATGSYLYHKDVKVARADRCINSSCDGQKCSVRFQRHMGECK